MAGVAFLLKKAGHDVSGCDLHSSPRTRWLEANGVPVALGHSPSHLTSDLDVCVFTPAVPKGNPEFTTALVLSAHTAMQRRGAAGDSATGPVHHGPAVKYRGEVLAEIFNAADGIAVCGTHGKTTTATFIAKLLRALGDDPSWCIGGETDDFPVAGTGSGPFVIEADESDGTLALYRARTLVVTSLDYDHPDHFKTYADYLACYHKAMAAAGEVIESEKLPTDDWPEIRPLVLGAHNVRNARTAVEVALRRGHAREAIRAALPDALSALPDRRFERLWPLPPQTFTLSSPQHLNISTSQRPAIFTDYAHHPAEIACALSMARALKPKRLRVMFQPHRYSRTKTLLNEFPPAFAEADETVLVPVYPAFEEPIPGGDIADLYLAFRNAAAGGRLLLARSAEEAWRHLFLTRAPGDLVMLLGAGDLIGLAPRIQSDMSHPPNAPASQHSNTPTLKHSNNQPLPLAPHSFFRTGGVTYGPLLHALPQPLNASETPPIILGMGSNTWFSDCATDAAIVRAPEQCPAAKPGATLLADHPELAFMAGIPGTIGGWAKMNAGAFDDSFGNHIDYVVADGKRIPAADCGFGYRTSSIPGLITEVALKPAGASGGSTVADYLTRRRKFPSRTCGSVFKNPSPEQPAGRLLEAAGAKSLRVGGAHVWQEHANVIVAGDGCTSSDILALARLMAACVRDRFGMTLVPEIRGLEV